MSISPEVPLLSVLIYPIDGAVSRHEAVGVNEIYAGLFLLGSDGGNEQGSGGFESLQFQGQPAFKSIEGPLEYIRFATDGTFDAGVQGAVDSRPDAELCGLITRLHREILQNRMADEDERLAPDSPKGAPVLLWRAEQGEAWETLIPARSPIVAGVSHRAAPINRTVKIRTVERWEASGGFEAIFDLRGKPQPHRGEAAVRFTWGDKYSLLMRGQGADAYPVLERRVDATWQQVRILNRGEAMGEKFWNEPHEFKLRVCGGRLMFEFDGQRYWVREFIGSGEYRQITAAKWGKAPLRLSVTGVACTLFVHRLTGRSGEMDAKGQPKYIEVNIEREIPMSQSAPPGQTIGFKTRGYGIGTAPLFESELRALLRGFGLDRVQIEGEWTGTRLSYSATLTCSDTESPLLCGFAAHFPASATAPAPMPIEFGAAVSQLTIDSGDPETIPDPEASFSVSLAMLDKLVPNWETALLPFRPVVIRAKYPSDEQWTVLFRGYLTPENMERSEWGDYEIPLIARGPMQRIMNDAGLIDERFAPLDLQLNEGFEQLFGAQCVKHLLEVELGADFVSNFNGNGDLFRYFAGTPAALLDTRGPGFFEVILAPQSGLWRLPAPYGENIRAWINTIEDYDSAVLLFDERENAFCYGRMPAFFTERGQQVWSVSESAAPPEAKNGRDFPLLSSLSVTGLLDTAYNDFRAWSGSGNETKGVTPAFLMGRAGDNDPTSTNPRSVAQSWRRTLLVKPDFIKLGVATQQNAQRIADLLYRQFNTEQGGKLDAAFETGLLKPRWGEILRLENGLDGNSAAQNWRILQVKHTFNRTGGAVRFSTVITSRPLSNIGE